MAADHRSALASGADLLRVKGCGYYRGLNSSNSVLRVSYYSYSKISADSFAGWTLQGLLQLGASSCHALGGGS